MLISDTESSLLKHFVSVSLKVLTVYPLFHDTLTFNAKREKKREKRNHMYNKFYLSDSGVTSANGFLLEPQFIEFFNIKVFNIYKYKLEE